MAKKKRVAVFFGGRSPEHDISVITGLQVLQAIDSRLYDSFPVYLTPQGEWFVGDALRERKNYLLTAATRASLTSVVLDVSNVGQGALLSKKRKMFGNDIAEQFDVAIPAFHGLVGEDGPFQGVMELANVPYTGMRLKACAVFMDKATTKYALMGTNVAMLPFVTIEKPSQGLLVPTKDLERQLAPIKYPCIVKPAHLGSSIGVGRATNLEEARAVLAALFAYDSKAIVETFVENLVEYNVAVRAKNGKIETSAIERPKLSAELLDFKQKYMSGGGKKSGSKAPGEGSQGMLSLTRDINPQIRSELEQKIRSWAEIIFSRLDGTGAPRIDFVSNSKTGEIWFNELNPTPGSFGYFLWDAAKTSVLFTELLNDLIAEAFAFHASQQLPDDPTPPDARIFKRPA